MPTTDAIDTTARDADDEAVKAVLERQPADLPGPEPDTPDPGAQVAMLPALPKPEQRSTVPAVNELQTMAQLATTFAHAGLVPKDLQGKPADCLLVIMSARDLGISITDGFRLLYPIDGRVTVAPKLKLAIIRQRGLAKMWPDPGNDATSATWHAERDGISYSQTFTMDDAKRADLQWKDNWKKYPAQMLSWRALGYLIDVAAPEVGTGLYSADELGAITDDDGNVIDVSEVPPVVETPKPPAEPTANASDLWRLQARILALPEAIQPQWAEAHQHGAGGTPVHQFTAQQYRGARSVVDGQMRAAAKKADPDFDLDEAAKAIRLQVGATVIGWLCWLSGGPNGEATPPEDVAAGARQAQPDEPTEAPPATPPEARPTVADAKEIEAQVTEVVKTWSPAEVRDALATDGLPTTGGAAACRKRLIGHLVQKDLRRGQDQ